MSLLDVRTALAQAFVDSAIVDSGAIEWENIAFDPPSDKLWARFTFMPSNPVPDTLGTGGRDMVDSFAQIDLNYPLGSGDDDAMQDYVALAAIFKAGARFASNGQTVVIKSCGRGNGANVSGFYRIPVTIVFYAQITR